MTEQHIDPATPLDRLDMMLVASGLVESRAKAQRLIKAGHVRVDGETITKPSFMVKAGHSELAVDKGDDYVSRGAYKLLGAFETFAGNGLTGPEGLECLDIGASTGGFTDVLLRGGAAKVVALDVGHGQLDPRIANDEHVIEMSGVNIREVEADDLPYRPAMIVSDVSFISLKKILPAAFPLLKKGGDALVLIKPQFEAGRENIGKNGLVQSSRVHMQVLNNILQLFSAQGLTVQLLCPSPIQGGSGNIEYLAVVQKGGEAAYLPEIAAVVQQAFAQAKKEKTK